MFYFDYTFILILPAVIFALFASLRVESVFNKYSKLGNARGITAAQAARCVLDRNGLYDVRIEYVRGRLTDHYDPRDNVIRLSESVYGSTSAAAIGVACHEAGHAVQYAENYAPIKVRQAIIPVTNIGSQIGIWLFLIGIIFSYLSQTMVILAYIGLFLFSFTAVFQLVTLPTRAMAAIRDSELLTVPEQSAAKEVLNAAALTYVASLAVSISQILRLLLILGGTRRR